MQTNVDPQEIAKFSAMASAWWDPQGDCKPLHELNPLRLEVIKKHLNLANCSVLDVGCGGGILAESLAQQGAQVTAIDLSEEALQVARLHAAEMGLAIDYPHIAAEAYAEKFPQHFDAITCMELLEHVPDPLSLITACSTLVKPGGKVFFSTLNRNLKSYLYAVIGAEYVLKMLPTGTHDYDKFIRPSELAEWTRKADLTINEFVGIHYSPLSKQFTLIDDVSVNYLAVCEKN